VHFYILVVCSAFGFLIHLHCSLYILPAS
jgi:hypothetical protein